MYTSQSSLNDDHVTPESTVERPTTLYKVKRTIECTKTQVVDKADTRIGHKTEERLIATIKSAENDRNLAFARRELEQVTPKVLMSKPDDQEVVVAFEAAII